MALPYKDIKKFILVRVDRVVFSTAHFGFAVEPFLDASSERECHQIT